MTFEETKPLIIEALKKEFLIKELIAEVEKVNSWDEFFAHDFANRWILYLGYKFFAEEQQQIIREKVLADGAGPCLGFAKNILKGRFIDGEPIIAREAWVSYHYAREVVNGRFEAGEKAIATSAIASYNYATEVIRKPFELGHEAMKKDPVIWCWYSGNILHTFLSNDAFPEEK